MLTGIIAFEWRHQTRQAVFAAAALAFLAMGFALVATGYGPPEVHVNSPFVAMQATGLLSLPAIFVLTIFCAGAVQRDAEHRMAEIVYATPVGKTRFLFGRFAGALAVSATVFAAATLGMLLAPPLAAVDPARLGPADVPGALWALLVMGLPNLVIAGSLVFAVAALTRSTLAAYVGAVFLYALYFVCAVLVQSPMLAGAAPSADALARAALIDPFGLSALFEQTRWWTPAMRDTRHLALEGRFLLNRVLWLAVSAAVLAVVHRRFALRVAAGAKRPRSIEEADDAPSSIAAYRPVDVGGRGAQGRALVSATRLQLAAVLRGKPFLALLALWAVVAWANLAGTDAAEYGSRLYPTTGILLDLLRAPLAELGTIVLVYFSAELAWRDRAAHLAEIVDATPAASAVLYLSRLAALALTAATLALAAVLVAAAFQLAHGWTRLEPALYLGFLLSATLPLALFAVAALLAHALSSNRYVGMVIALLLAIVTLRGDGLGLEHHLARFASGPVARHSDLAGGGQVAASWRWFMLYWTAFAGVMAFATVGAWRRGTLAPLGARLRALPRRLGRRGMMGAAACLALFLATGAFVYRQADVVNRWETADDARAWRAGYERAYRRIAAAPQPSVVSVRADVDLYPASGGYRVAGVDRLENRSGRPIDTVWVTVDRDVARAELSLAGAELVVRDERYGVRGFRLRRPLAPGASAELAYRISAARRGIRSGGFDLSVVDNGSFLTHRQALPSLGYRQSWELRDPAQRARAGLPPRQDPAAALAEADGEATGDRVAFETTVSTEGGQVAIAPGELRGTWRRGGRRYFRYASSIPINRQLAWASARYAVRRAMHHGVAVEVYFHPGHAANVDRMLRAATASLDAFGAAFGPYPHRSLRIVEVPPYWGFGALAMPGVIFFGEDRGFLTDARDGDAPDLVTRRVAHEVGHQWWAHQVTPGDGPGASLVVESLAKYSEQMVLRRLRGEAEVARLRELDLERYRQGRAQDAEPEPPLDRVSGQAWLYYGKGAVVMGGLRDLLGERAMNDALRGFVAARAWPHPAPSARDLAATLRAAAPPADRALVDQWLGQVVTYDLAVESAAARPLPGGRWQVTARLRAAKAARRGTADVPLPMDEALDVAVYAADPRGGASPVYAARHRVRGGVAEVSAVVGARPAFVAIDPAVLRVDPERGDNLRAVEDSTAETVVRRPASD